MTGNTTRAEAKESFFVFIRDNNTGAIRRTAIPGDVQIGLDGAPAELHLLGRFSIASKTYIIDNSNKGVISISNDDTLVALSLSVTPLSGRIRLTLPTSPREGQLHFIKDLSGTAGTVPIDIIPGPSVTIDGFASKSLIDNYGSLALVWLNGQWRILVAGIGTSGGSGTSADLSYVTINPEPSLTSERHLASSSNVTVTDQGPGAGVVLNLSQILGSGAGSYTYTSITVDAYGRITHASSGAPPPSTNSGFLTAGAEPSLPNRRVMSGGLGTVVNDRGAGSTFDYGVNPVIIPFLTGNNVFSGFNAFNAGLTGSLHNLVDGTSYIAAGAGINVFSASSGQVTIQLASQAPQVPVFTLQALAGTVTTNSSDDASKQTLGMLYFNPTLIGGFSGSRTFWYRSILDASDVPVPAMVDLYDVNGIINGFPGTITGSVMSSSSGTPTQSEVDLTGQLANVTGSGIFEARLWRSGSMLSVTSSVTCHNARLEVQFS